MVGYDGKSIKVKKPKNQPIVFKVIINSSVSPNNPPGKHPLQKRTRSTYSEYEVPEEVVEKLEELLRVRINSQSKSGSTKRAYKKRSRSRSGDPHGKRQKSDSDDVVIEVKPQQTERGDKEVQQRIEIMLEEITGTNHDEYDEQGTYDTMETFALHHNLDFERAVRPFQHLQRNRRNRSRPE